MSARLIVRIVATLCATVGFMVLPAVPAGAFKEYVPSFAFGEPCSVTPCGNGQFNEPAGVAVNDATGLEPTAGDVYVVDRGDNRVERFSSAGAYLGQFDGSGPFEAEGKVESGPAAPTGKFASPEKIAVDDSGNPLDPSVGDVYVEDVGHKAIDKFSSLGEYISQPTETSAGEPFGELLGIAVDPSGDLWAYEATGKVSEFTDTGSFVPATSFTSNRGSHPGLAVDSSGSVYLIPNSGSEGVSKFESGKEVVEFAPSAADVAIDPSTGNVLVDKSTSVELYGPSGGPPYTRLQSFAAGILRESHGITVSKSDVAYVTQGVADNVETFDYVLFPTATTEAATQVAIGSATLQGTVNPEGEPVSECRFEYGATTSYGQSAPCVQTSAQIGAGSQPVPVSAPVSGLQSDTTYHFRLEAANTNGTGAGEDLTLHTTGPGIEGESALNLGSDEATLAARIDAQGEPTTYRVEYGIDNVSESSSAEESVGAPDEFVNVRVVLNKLRAGVQYRYRFTAASPAGTAPGEEKTFGTSAATAASALTLPDNRAYELVSSPTSNANVYPPAGELEPSNATLRLVRAAAGGDAVVYQGDPPSEGGSGDTGPLTGNAYMATRGPGGWTQTVLQFIGGLAYQGFSSDLSVGVLNPELFGASEQATIPSAVPSAPGNCKIDPLFSYTVGDDDYHALFSETSTQSTDCRGEFAGGNEGTATVPRYSHLLLQSYNAWVSGAIKELPEGQFNLYDSVGGDLHLVSVLPDGKAAGDVTFVGNEGYSRPDGITESSVRGSPSAISADGSRVFWMESEKIEGEHYRPKALYVRENDIQPQSPIANGECVTSNDACTVQIDVPQAGAEGAGGGGLFWSASSDGSKVFFTDESRLTIGSTAATGEPDLYEYEVNPQIGRPGKLTDLTVDTHAGEHANVQGMMGTSEDGSYAYFVANGVLSAGRNVEGREPIAGQPNLYVRHDGATTFVAQAGAENQEWHAGGSGAQVGNLFVDVANRTAEVTPDGHDLVFRSRMKLTGYEDLGLHEVFVYDAETGRLSCTSCNPTGALPTGDVAHSGRDASLYKDGSSLTVSANSDFTLRWISEDGARVFFVTGQPLVAQDVNGLQDVYEWERPASDSEPDNSCTRSSEDFSEVNGGCVYLLSGGTSADDSYFLDASANGSDVFFRTRGRLTTQSVDENMALYDARVNGGFSETRLACTGTGCQGVPPAPPMFATPSSVTFNGAGNFSTAPPAAKKIVKKLAQCGKGKRPSHGRCVKKKHARKATRGKASPRRSKRNRGKS